MECWVEFLYYFHVAGKKKMLAEESGCGDRKFGCMKKYLDGKGACKQDESADCWAGVLAEYPPCKHDDSACWEDFGKVINDKDSSLNKEHKRLYKKIFGGKHKHKDGKRLDDLTGCKKKDFDCMHTKGG